MYVSLYVYWHRHRHTSLFNALEQIDTDILVAVYTLYVVSTTVLQFSYDWESTQTE